jgi:hypothetical protein
MKCYLNVEIFSLINNQFVLLRRPPRFAAAGFAEKTLRYI